MKSFFAFGVLAFALTICGFTDQFTGGGTDTADKTNQPEVGSGNGADGGSTDEVSTAELTSDLAALQSMETKRLWEEQGIVLETPKGMAENEYVSKNSFQYGSPAKGFLIGSISSLGDNFPTDVSLKSYYDQSVQKAKDGDYEKVQYTQISGIKGVEFVESKKEDSGDPRRYQWIGYRKYNDQTQMLNIMVSHQEQ